MAKYAANGATITIGGVAIPNVVSFGVPSDSADEIDVSDHSSDRRSFVNGLIDSDDMTIELIYDPAEASHASLRTAVGQAAESFVITLSGPSASHIHTFSALVKGFAIDLPADGALTATATIKRTGADSVTSV
jgi:hypothetical protein